MPDRARRRLVIALTVLGAAGVYLAGNGSVGLWDRDEPRYAQCSRQMLQSGDWVVPRLYDEVRTAKPVFIYWCQAGTMRWLGDTAFAARFPSAAAMPITLLVFAAFAWHAAGPRRAVWATLVLATSVMVLISAKACLTDSVLLLWVTVGQICLYAIWCGHATWPIVFTFSVSIAVGGLTKGPVVLGVHAMTALAFFALGRTVTRRPTSSPVPAGNVAFKAFVGLLLIAAIIGPWLYLVEERVPGFVGTALLHDVVRRSGTALEKHGGPPGYHLATIWVFFLPWSLLLPLAAVLGWKNRHLPLVRFALAAVGGPWLLFELVSTKLPHYMLPTYPWLALLVADAVVRCLRGQHSDLERRPFRSTVTAWAVAVAAAGVVVPVVIAVRFGSGLLTLWLTAALVAYAAALLVFLTMRRTAGVVASLGVGVALAWAIAWLGFFPRASFLRLSIQAADVLKREGATGPGQAIMLDYKEPSLGFYAGGNIRQSGKMELSDELLDEAPPWLVITDEVWRRTPEAVRGRVDVIAAFRGLAYADEGRVVELMVVRKHRPGHG